MHGLARIKASALLLLLILLLSCTRQIKDPVSPPKDEPIPPTPTNVTATVGDRFVTLTWTVSDTGSIAFYRVYMADSSAENYSMIAEVNESRYTANDLQNGDVYYFRVSTVNLARFEGYLSLPVSAEPNLYQIMINSGDEYANDRNVTLTLVAPAGTQYMQISNDSLFSNSPWDNFASTRSWLLPSGDGLARVYARFRDSNDRTTDGYYWDAISLDTQASIDSVTFFPAGTPFFSGDQVHFLVYTVEARGEARVTLGQNLVRIDLYDDGTHGDLLPNDGIYETDYVINANLDFENAGVFGNFTDVAENVAQQAQATQYISVRRAPDPVTIFNVSGVYGYYDRLEVSWTRSSIGDFGHYRVYRSTGAGVDSTDFLARTISSAATTSLVDTGLAQNATYYYKVYVVDNTGLWAGSNELSGQTNPNAPPDPVNLFPPVALPGTHDRLSISWSECNDQDFLRYELFRSYDSDVDSSDIVLLVSESQTTFTDTGLMADSVYYYRVRTLDQAGNSSWSNSASGRTGIDQPPEPATLFPVIVQPDYYENLELNWSHSSIPDFQAFRVYFWRESDGRNDSMLIAIIPDESTTTLTDNPSFDIGGDTLVVWYVVQTSDQGGNSTASNAIDVRLIDAVPGQVTGAVIPGSTSIAVSWIPLEIPDFSSYRLLRDTTSNPDQASVILMTPDQDVSSYDDENLVQGLTYYYWLEINDRRDHVSRSFLGSSPW